MGESHGDYQRRLNRIAGEVQKFLELFHKIEPGTGTNEQPYDRKAKGSSRPPLSDRALMLSKANEHASSKITPVLGSLLKSHLGDPYANVLAEHIYNPGALRQWRAGQSQEDQAKGEDFWEMCRLVAKRLMDRWDAPGQLFMLVVYTDPRDAEADSPKQAAAIDREARHQIQEDEAKRRQAAHIRDIQAQEGCGVRAAVGLWSDRMGISERTGWRALAFVKGRSTEVRPEDGVWRDFGDDDNGGEAA